MTTSRAAVRRDVPWTERSRVVRAGRLWRTRRPRTFTEKVQYKMLRDRRPLLVTFADKAAVRDYVADRIGAQYLPTGYGVVADPDEVWALDLPPSFVVKPTHGSGAVVAVRPDAPTGVVLPSPEHWWVCTEIRPEDLDRAAFAALARSWLRTLHGHGPNTEWAYSFVPPRLLVEEFLPGPDGGVPDDHKFFVFHGRCEYVQIDTGRFDRHTQDFFTRDWRHLPFHGGLPLADPPPPRPERLDEMIAVAEKLGADTDFVRVDLYAQPERVVFGELTSYPGAGHGPFHPPEWNAVFGSHWTVPRRY